MRVMLTTKAGGEIIGELRQKHPTKRLLIICNGLRASVDHPTTKAISEGLYEKGHAVVTFNFSDTRGTNIQQQVTDILQLIQHFKSYESVVLLGASFGALSSSIAAIQSSKVKGLVTVNGFFGLPHLGLFRLLQYLIFKIQMHVGRGKKIWQFFTNEFQVQKITCPVLVIHSKADKDVFIRQSAYFYAQLLAPKEFYTLKTSDHNLQPGNEINATVEAINTWLLKNSSV